ncbi:MAG: sulfatase [Bacteroidota bacterium]
MKPLVFVLLVATISIHACSERDASKTTDAKRPNILIAISDDQSFAHTSFAGSRFVSTPAFDRVASSGIYFSNCFAGSPGCAPSRSALITGRHHWQNEQSGQHAAGWFKKYVPVVDVLSARGYYVGKTGKGVGPFRYAQDEADSLLRRENAAGPDYSARKYDGDDDPRPADGIRALDYAANFADFIAERPVDSPFYFWYGASEPHRRFEYQSGSRAGKRLEDAQVPDFLPDVDTIREDLLDYALEIEWFDTHLGRMLDLLDSLGELDNTLVIVTSDNGMAFPRAKANAYDYGIHVPMAISMPSQFQGDRKILDPIGFIDVTPTILDVTGVGPEGMLPVTGQSLVPILSSSQSGSIDAGRTYAYSGRERHSSTRWKNLGYPQRAVRSETHLLIWNMKPERAPAGVPIMLDPESGEPNPMHGLQDGRYLPGTAYHDIDDCPTKTFMIEQHEHSEYGQYFDWSMAHRPEFEFYDIEEDPYCLQNLYETDGYQEIISEMQAALNRELMETEDPRLTEVNPEIFDTYPRYSRMRSFPAPEWAGGE